MMLAMLVEALSFTSCSSSSDDDNDTSKIEQNTDSTKPIEVKGISRAINLQTAGTLSSFISEEDAPNIGQLKLSGHMDARDFDFIKWKCMKIEVVDMADVVIDKYKGADGTNEGYDATYGANEIPMGAFFYWNTSKKYDYPGMPRDEGMASLKKIVLPQGITAIRRNAFARAYNLTEINIPEGVKEIDFVSFAICQSLKEITLPSTLKEVGKQAFADMSSLEKMTVLATTPPTAVSNSFQGIANKATLFVPKGTKSLYAKATGWKEFATIDDGESITDVNNSSIVGVWEVINFETNLPGASIKGDRIYFNANGTYNDPSNEGTWSIKGSNIIANFQDGSQIIYVIDSITDNEMTLRTQNGTISLVLYLKRVTDGNNNQGDNSSKFTISFNGDINEVENTSLINPIFVSDQQKGSYFCLDNYPLGNGQIHILFPNEKYNGNVSASFFYEGFSDFGNNEIKFEYVISEGIMWGNSSYYQSGSAKVVKNTGDYITIEFSDYSFGVEYLKDRILFDSRKFVLNGTLTFKVNGDNDNEASEGSGSSYIQVKIDGKTYKEAIPEWIYAQINNMGTDSQGKKLSYTYDMVAHFEETEGFLFMFGITHYRNKTDLLASSPGSYPFARDTADDEIYNNLAFTCLYELDGDEYTCVSGTHQVKSIKSEGSDVRVEGSFTAVFKYNGDTKNIQGSYSILIPF